MAGGSVRAADLRLKVSHVRRLWEAHDLALAGLMPTQVIRLVEQLLAEARQCMPDTHSQKLNLLEREAVSFVSQNVPAGSEVQWNGTPFFFFIFSMCMHILAWILQMCVCAC